MPCSINTKFLLYSSHWLSAGSLIYYEKRKEAMLKHILYYIVSAAYISSSTYFMPLFFLLAFNYGKGIQNNEDGIIFIPFGFLLIVLSVLIDVLLVRKALKMNRDHRRNKLLIATVLIVIFIVSFILNFSTWETFFECFGHYRGFNLGLQR